jgi:hypothetical protein
MSDLNTILATGTANRTSHHWSIAYSVGVAGIRMRALRRIGQWMAAEKIVGVVRAQERPRIQPQAGADAVSR